MTVTVAISNVHDGDMKINNLESKNQVLDNRTRFLSKNNVKLSDTTLVRVTYGGADFARYHKVDTTNKGQGMSIDDGIVADGLVTGDLNHALFLPLADCVGAVIYDPVKSLLMVSHLGRHSLEQNGGFKSIEFLVENYHSNPEDLKIWLTPAPSRKSYPVFTMEGKGLKDLALNQLKSAGILSTNIVDNQADTSTDPNYFSHSEFLKGNRNTDGRYAIVAVIK